MPFPQLDLHVRTPGGRSASALPAEHLAADADAAQARDLGPSAWSEAELAAALKRLAASGEVAIRDRRHLLQVYRQTFVGREAVDWLVMNEELTRAEAVELGERSIALGLVRHVLDEHGFRDGQLYYRVEGGAAGGHGASGLVVGSHYTPPRV